MQKLTIKCNLCEITLVVVEKPLITDEDQQCWLQGCSCNTLQSDGLTMDNQSALTAIVEDT